MIEKKEIEEKSKEFEIHPSNVERDYVFGWLLYGIFTVSNLKDVIFLKGGNALRKGYFENTRYSSDLDFGIPNDIQQSVLLAEINKVCDFITEKAGVIFEKESNRLDEKFTATNAPIPGLRVYDVRVYFKDFYGKQDHIKIKISMDITRFDKTILPIQDVKLIHPYSDDNMLNCIIRCMKVEEIIATKLKCLLQRQHAPDLFDYVHSIKLLGGELDKNEVVDALIKKTIFRRNPSVLKNIFSKYPDSGYMQFAYFGPEFRVPIMNAGRSQTLLKIRYKGEERIVEPYSLKYLQKRDGTEKEYFYAYKLRGGSSAPGIKAFIAERMQSVENTEEKFEPRHMIELCKAGEKPENPYLFDPNKPTKEPRSYSRGVFSSRSRISSYGPRYVYQCSYCGKKFYRKNRDTSLGKHKDKNGYPCNGRYGYYVDTKY